MSRAPKKPIVNPDERSRANRYSPLIVLGFVGIGILGLVIVLEVLT